MKKFIKDYANFWHKYSHNENGKRICKKPFTNWIITCLVITMLTLIISSCGTAKQGGGCGRSPIHLGN